MRCVARPRSLGFVGVCVPRVPLPSLRPRARVDPARAGRFRCVLSSSIARLLVACLFSWLWVLLHSVCVCACGACACCARGTMHITYTMKYYPLPQRRSAPTPPDTSAAISSVFFRLGGLFRAQGKGCRSSSSPSLDLPFAFPLLFRGIPSGKPKVGGTCPFAAVPPNPADPTRLQPSTRAHAHRALLDDSAWPGQTGHDRRNRYQHHRWLIAK